MGLTVFRPLALMPGLSVCGWRLNFAPHFARRSHGNGQPVGQKTAGAIPCPAISPGHKFMSLCFRWSADPAGNLSLLSVAKLPMWITTAAPP